ncbi:MAG: tetratricopeptide repeat protein [Melioribacteraceae bacterium]|jgi:tetratricopeptide (TPR) repeat protein|nr:tetratricopeptide repeat protein [Melioribacteraceae bacterium]
MKKVFIYLSLASMIFGIMAFQCASAELTGAKLYINQKQYEKAKEALNKEVAKNPLSDEGWYLLGFLHGEDGNIDEMLAAFDKSMSASNKFAPQIKEAKLYHWATSFNKGVSVFNNASKTTDADSIKMYFQKSADLFISAIKCEPDSEITYTNLAMTYINMGENEKAVSPLEKLVSFGKSADAYVMLGQIYLDKGNELNDKADSAAAQVNFEKAISILEKGREKFPDDSEILLRVSNAYIGANKLEVAMDAFKKGVVQEPDNKFYKYNYGVLLLNSGDFPAAEEQFTKAVALDSEYTNAVYNLAVTYVRWGAKMREEMEAKGENNELYKEKFKLAIPHLEKYLSVNPKEPVIWELLGRVYANLGMQEKSLEAFEKADANR